MRTLKEKNELIARFMKLTCSNNVYLPSSNESLDIDKYDEDWNKLMPVVLKIQKILESPWFDDFFQDGDGDDHYSTFVGITLLEIDIESVYEAVFDFVEWYMNLPEDKKDILKI